MRERGTALFSPEIAAGCLGLADADLLSRCVQPDGRDPGSRTMPNAGVLVSLLIDRQLVVDTGVVGYIALRIERSLDAGALIIDALDREALARHSRISRPIAGDVLLAMGHGGE